MDTGYLRPEPADRPIWSDKLLAKYFLPILPRWVLPNHLTMLRFMLVPVVVYLLLGRQWWWGTVLFIVASVTDALDGALARTGKQITTWGKMYDPLADKLLVGFTAFLVLPAFYGLELIFMIVAVELLLIGGAYYFKGKYQGRIQANWWGKSKMICQSTGLGMVLVAVSVGAPFLLVPALWLLWCSVALAVVSLLTYSI